MKPMKLWSIQTRAAWEQLQREGVLYGTYKYAESDFIAAYQWLSQQMLMKLPAPTCSTAQLPVWAWYQYRNVKKHQPDLRESSHLPRGTQGVRIKLVKENQEVLFSDFDLWHYVLNYWYLPTTLSDGEQFEALLSQQGLSFHDSKPLPEAKFHSMIEQSWQKIFDFSWTNEDIAYPITQKSIQATFWELRLEEVQQVDYFVAR